MSKTILAVLAHPDDESFGLEAHWHCTHKKGMTRIWPVRGEVGTVDEEHLNGFKDTAELRTAELSAPHKF